ncbi:hypothetical protein ACET3Z_017113 [Daucus carota]
MDPSHDSLSASLFKWDSRNHAANPPPQNRLVEVLPPPQMPPAPPTLSGLEELFEPYGIRYFTAAKIGELGFTVNTLLNMKDQELDEMMTSLSHIFRWDLLVGERYGIKAAVRAERRRILEQYHEIHRHPYLHDQNTNHALDAFSQEGLSEEPVQQVYEGTCSKRKQRGKNIPGRLSSHNACEVESDDEEDENVCERQREHPFIVTEPGEVARGKKNGLDYLFNLYEQCRSFLIQVQNIAKSSGEKCPTKVTNQVFRYAKEAGASYINKPKMRHYVHCYALHCLDEETSNALRRAYKERGENVGSWRQACYKPLVNIASRQGWDIDLIFSTHPRLSIWYVPTKLRQLCHAERSSRAAATSSSINYCS